MGHLHVSADVNVGLSDWRMRTPDLDQIFCQPLAGGRVEKYCSHFGRRLTDKSSAWLPLAWGYESASNTL